MSTKARLDGWSGDGLRFLLAGAINTLITLVAYELLLFFAPTWLAYSSSWVMGLLFVVVFYPSRVFARARRDFTARLWLGTSYVLVFVIGLAALRLLEAREVPSRLAIFAVLALTTSSNFLLGRFVLRSPNGCNG
jgi:putative flippase GtrA